MLFSIDPTDFESLSIHLIQELLYCLYLHVRKTQIPQGLGILSVQLQRTQVPSVNHATSLCNWTPRKLQMGPDAPYWVSLL